MPNQKQRRDAARRHLERQLQARQARDARRKQITLISSIVGTLVLIVAIVIIVVATTGSSKKKSPGIGAGGSSSSSPSTSSAAASACPTGSKPVRVAAGSGPAVSFHGVTVKGATDLSKSPSIGSTSTTPPDQLMIKDLVVGKGKAASPTSSVSVKYTGILYCDGSEFDGPAEHGDKAITFSLTQVVPGFTQGIGGASGIPPMKVGGRRIIIMPAAMGYGANGNPPAIPGNAPLVFIVDLTKVA